MTASSCHEAIMHAANSKPSQFTTCRVAFPPNSRTVISKKKEAAR